MTDDAAEHSSATQVLEAHLRYHRRGQGRPVVLLHPLRMQLEYSTLSATSWKMRISS
jgi:hypothetical protein